MSPLTGLGRVRWAVRATNMPPLAGLGLEGGAGRGGRGSEGGPAFAPLPPPLRYGAASRRGKGRRAGCRGVVALGEPLKRLEDVRAGLHRAEARC
jgi:hypothetical protein